MILFAADNHYGAHCGKVLCEQLKDRLPIDFYEDDWSCFAQPGGLDRYQLLILHLIADTCDVPPPGPEVEPAVKAYLEAGKPLLLLHGASAAFWHWEWWRPIVGWRWVRGNDPDGIPASTHPKRPYRVDLAKCRHPLVEQLQPLDLPEDEIYIHLEQTSPTLTLMTTTTDEGTFPQAYVGHTPWGGTLIGYLPGHRPEVVGSEPMVANCLTLIRYLCQLESGN